MKKILYTLLCFFCFSCNNNDIEIQEPTHPTSNKVSISTRAAGDGKHDLLGYGYNFLYALGDNYKGATNPVIDIEKYTNGKAVDPNTGKVVNIPNGKIEVALSHGDLTEYQEFGTSLHDFYQKIKGKMEIKNGGASNTKIIPNWGILELTYDYDKEIRNKERNSFFKLDLCLNTQRTYFSSINIKRLKYFLSDDFIFAIHNYTAKEIVDDYGTHVLTDIYTGGKVSVLASALDRSNNQSNIQSLTKNIMGYISGNINKTIKINNNISNLSFMVLQSGGSNPVSTKIIQSDSGIIKTDFMDWNQWKSGVDTQHSTLIHTNLEKVIPIWCFIDNPKLQMEVIQEIYKRGQELKLGFSVLSVPEFTLTSTNATEAGVWDTRNYRANNNILSFDKDDYWTIILKKRLDCHYIINHKRKFYHSLYMGATPADTLRIEGKSVYFELPNDYLIHDLEYNRKYYNKAKYRGYYEYFKDSFEDVLEIIDSEGNTKEVAIKFNFKR